MTFAPCSFENVYMIENFPCKVRLCCMCCMSYSSDRLFFSPPPRWAVLLLDCITCFASVWLSLVGCWSFLASLDFSLSIQPWHPHILRHHGSWWLPRLFFSRLLCFCSQELQRQLALLCQGEDEGTSSLSHFLTVNFSPFCPLTAENNLFLCLFEQLPKQQPTVPDQGSAPTVTMRNKSEFFSRPPPSLPV